MRLTITDTGEGMDSVTLERIFDPYFTTKEKGVGTGLGLSVVHGIVRDHGGAVTVRSEKGKGSAFEVFFPFLMTGEKIKVKEFEPVPRGTERILLVDDEETLVDLGKRMLGHLGYHVIALTSSIEALDTFRAAPERFDLIITDMTMPGMTGDVLTGEILKIRPDIPVILCTGFSERLDEDSALQTGAGAFVMKPMVLQEIGRLVRRLLDGPGVRRSRVREG